MVKADFARWLKQALTYFERKEPSDATVNLWYEKVKNIPAGALPQIYQEVTGMEVFPRNLPAFMQAKAREWLAANPQTGSKCECHRGLWEVAFWRPELEEWAIFSIPCGPCNGKEGPRQCYDLLSPKFYDREPDRYMETPPPWALIYPDKDSLHKKCQEIRDYLKQRRHDRARMSGLGVEEALPF